MSSAPPSPSRFGSARILVSVLLGLVGSGMVWWLQPYNNFLLNNSFIADHFLPELVVGLILLLTLAVNPLVRLVRPEWCLTTRQLALVFGIMLAATTLSQTMRIYPHSLARGNRDACNDAQLAEIHREMKLPKSLYLDQVEYGQRAAVSEQLCDRLDPGKSIPWRAWLPALLGWGTMIGAVWLIMVGLGLILFPQWRDNERLPFPLLAVQQELIQAPEEGQCFPPLFHQKLFWVGCLLVTAVYLFNGLHHHTGKLVPEIPLGWNLTSALSEGMGRHLHWLCRVGQIYFLFVGITFFMPNRVGFSLWFTFLAYQVYRMLGFEYFAPFNYETSDDHRNGAILAVAVIIIWLGREQWLKVFRAMFRRTGEDEVKERDRAAGWMFAAGLALLFGWLLWAKVSPGWAAAFVAITFVTALILARIVCETGLPFLAVNDFGPSYFMHFFSGKWLTYSTAYVGGFLNMMLAAGGSRTSAAVLAMHGLGLDKEAKPRQHRRLAGLFYGVMLLGIVVCGAVHLRMSYHHSSAMYNPGGQVSEWGSQRVLSVHTDLKSLQRGAWRPKAYNQPGHFLLGVALGAGLQGACLLSPGWPLHPVGLLILNSWFIGVAWASVMLGWCLKMLIVKYGGAQSYRVAKPFFLGLIVGEVVSAIVWAAVPLALMYFHGEAMDVGRILVLPQ